jgi:hypothetical protein
MPDMSKRRRPGRALQALLPAGQGHIRGHSKNREAIMTHTKNEEAMMAAALAAAFASMALDYVRTETTYPAFSAWLAASTGMPAITREQLARADLFISELANTMFSLGPDEPGAAP